MRHAGSECTKDVFSIALLIMQRDAIRHIHKSDQDLHSLLIIFEVRGENGYRNGLRILGPIVLFRWLYLLI